MTQWQKCGITVGHRRKDRIPVKNYREVLHQYLYHPESKSAGPDGRPCDPWTRGVLERRHIIPAELNCCGKEWKKKLEQGPVDHETDFKAKVYANGRVSADAEILRALGSFSEREINKATGFSRRIIRRIRHNGQVKPTTLRKITDFLTRYPKRHDFLL
jgi:hypothetical protein